MYGDRKREKEDYWEWAREVQGRFYAFILVWKCPYKTQHHVQ